MSIPFDRLTSRPSRGGGVLLAGILLVSAGGCLSLGGSTTYLEETPETKARISSLETRVGALEQAFSLRSTAPASYESVAPAAPPQ